MRRIGTFKFTGLTIVLISAIGFCGCRAGAPGLSGLAFWKKDNATFGAENAEVAPPATHFDPEPTEQMALNRDGVDDNPRQTKDKIERILEQAKKANANKSPGSERSQLADRIAKAKEEMDGKLGSNKQPLRKPYELEAVDQGESLRSTPSNNDFDAGGMVKRELPDLKKTLDNTFESADRTFDAAKGATTSAFSAVAESANETMKEGIARGAASLNDLKRSSQDRELWRKDINLPANQGLQKIADALTKPKDSLEDNGFAPAIRQKANGLANGLTDRIKSQGLPQKLDSLKTASENFQGRVQDSVASTMSEANDFATSKANDLKQAGQSFSNSFQPAGASSNATFGATARSGQASRNLNSPIRVSSSSTLLSGSPLAPTNNRNTLQPIANKDTTNASPFTPVNSAQRNGNAGYPATNFKSFQPSSEMSKASFESQHMDSTTKANQIPSSMTAPNMSANNGSANNGSANARSYSDAVVLPDELLRGTTNFAPGSIPTLKPKPVK